MKYNCPLCAADLKGARLRKVPRPGEFKFLALRWHLECPHCLGELMLHPHPSESFYEWRASYSLSVLLVWAAHHWVTDYWVRWGIIMVAILYPYVKVRCSLPKDWQRYSVWQEKKFKK